MSPCCSGLDSKLAQRIQPLLPLLLLRLQVLLMLVEPAQFLFHCTTASCTFVAQTFISGCICSSEAQLSDALGAELLGKCTEQFLKFRGPQSCPFPIGGMLSRRPHLTPLSAFHSEALQGTNKAGAGGVPTSDLC